MPIYYVRGSRSKYPQYAPPPKTQRLPGQLDWKDLKPAHVLKARDIISALAGEKGVLLNKGVPFLTPQELSSSTNVATKPIFLVSAHFVMSMDSEVKRHRKTNAQAPKLLTLAQFKADGSRISKLVKAHLVGELKEIPELRGRRVNVTVGLDLGNNPILAVDVA